MLRAASQPLRMNQQSQFDLLAFCLAEALLEDFNLHTIAGNFVNWKYHGYWTALGTVFDIGITTSDAISRLKAGTQPELAGGFLVKMKMATAL